jgi:hypothetical protein
LAGRHSLAILPATVLAALFLSAAPARAQLAPQERLCDPSFEDCRADLLTYIKQENVGIDAAFWMMSDDRYASAIILRWQAGVPVRLLVDPRCVSNHPACGPALDKLRAAGIPMRYRNTSGILHWKMMLFAGQGQVEFSGANYVPYEFRPEIPYVNYTDEVIYYTDEDSVVRSFMTKFDDLWTSSTEFKNYANVTTLTRNYPTFTKDPALNFPPDESYRSRAVGAYNKETEKIDVMMFRITDVSHTNAIVNAVKRGVKVRLITDETEYRNEERYWDSYNVDIMYRAGVDVRLDAHQGIDHAKLVLLYGQSMTIFGSSNWTSPSSSSQREHNYFTTKPWIRDWAINQYERKWNNSAGYTETKPFVPLPPGKPTYLAPASASIQPTSGVVLRWHSTLWSHLYDVYFGTTPDPPLLAQDLALGPSESANDDQSYALPALQPGTTYYWKIVSKTMAEVPSDGGVATFTTSGTPPGGGGSTLPSPWIDTDIGAVGAPGSASFSNPTFTVAGAGADVWGSSDALHFVYQPMSGDGTIVARVASVQNTASWAKVGVMIRSSLSPGAAQGFMLVSAGKGLAFQRRVADGGSSTSTPGSTARAPRWVKLTRSGNTIQTYESGDGSSWTPVGSDSIALPSTALVGLAVSSHVAGVTCTSTFDSVSVSGNTDPPPPPPPPPPSTLPTGWDHADVGAVSAAGDSSYQSGAFTVKGRGADIWGTADAFQFAYHAFAGDGDIIARVASITNTNSWTKAGVMIRATLAAGSPHAFVLVSPSKGVAFQRRATANGTTDSTPGTLSTAPRWVKLTRSGNLFTAYESGDGSTWTPIGSATISMPSSVFAGLAVTSHTTSATATAVFDGVQ